VHVDSPESLLHLQKLMDIDKVSCDQQVIVTLCTWNGGKALERLAAGYFWVTCAPHDRHGTERTVLSQFDKFSDPLIVFDSNKRSKGTAKSCRLRVGGLHSLISQTKALLRKWIDPEHRLSDPANLEYRRHLPHLNNAFTPPIFTARVTGDIPK
jgi:hypothetical protein